MSRRLLIATLIASAAVARLAAAPPPPARPFNPSVHAEPPEGLQRAPTVIVMSCSEVGFGRLGHLSGSGRLTGFDACHRYLHSTQLWRPEPEGADLTVWYPPVKAGSMIPAFSYIYRVDEIQPLAHPLVYGTHELRLHWVRDKDLPAGLTRPAAGALPIPLAVGNIGKARVPGADVSAEQIDKQLVKTTARLRVSAGGAAKPTMVTVETGDGILIAGVVYKVGTLVPAEEKTGVVGWVELLAPLTVDMAKRAKWRIVEPKTE